MEPIIMKNEAIQDEAILSKCREALDKLSNSVEMFPVPNVGMKSKSTVEHLVGSLDAMDDTVLFIRDHCKGLINNSTLSHNEIFRQGGDDRGMMA